jgi:hypothetical protein
MAKISRRTASGDDKRGNSTDRAARKAWMLNTFGDGTHVACVHCGVSLTSVTLQADRIVPGGTYRRSNIQPSCASDNRARSNNVTWLSPLALAANAVDAAMSTLVDA